MGERVSKSTASVELHDQSTGKKERSNRAAGIRLCFLAITKTLIKKYKHRRLAYSVNILESELISCAPVYFPLRWDKKFCSQSCVSPAHRICRGGFLRWCASGKKLGYPS